MYVLRIFTCNVICNGHFVTFLLESVRVCAAPQNNTVLTLYMSYLLILKTILLYEYLGTVDKRGIMVRDGNREIIFPHSGIIDFTIHPSTSFQLAF